MNTRFFRAQTLALLLLLPGPLLALDFKKFTRLKTGKKFTVSTSRHGKIGEGFLEKLTKNSLRVRFNLRAPPNNKFIGFISMKKLKTRRGKTTLRLIVKGDYGFRKERINEVVTVDDFMADGGILTFRYDKGKRFLQLSINSKKENKVVTEYGVATLKP